MMRTLSMLFVLSGIAAPLMAGEEKAIDIGSRRELFVDDFLTDQRKDLELRLHPPVAREVVMVHDAPWEGSGCGFYTIFRDGDIVRMYYVAGQLTNEDGTKLTNSFRACYAESKDGRHWVKPDLGLFEWQGSKQNNIIWTAPAFDNFTPFKDPNPDSPQDQLYKAVGLGRGGLFAYKSADGIHWAPISDQPIITKGAFDTQNNAFWDPLRKQYWCYIRDFHNGLRDIRVSTSPDFVTWTTPEALKYVDSPEEQLYTNQIRPYYRAPHLFVGFPTRYTERAWSPSMSALPFPEHRKNRAKFQLRYGTAVTDGLFMTSRDGRTFRRWDEVYLRPGPERKHNWLYGDGYQNLGLLETAAEDPDAPNELSVYAIEDLWVRATRLRRYTLRIDGFVSLHARLKGGDFISKPLVFSGQRLTLNFATSGAGNVLAELLDEKGQAIPGFALADCDPLFGDTLERTVSWKEQSDLSALAGRTVLLRLVLRDADVYSLRFAEATEVTPGS